MKNPNISKTGIYRGDTKFLWKHGKGTLFKKNGDAFVGEFINGKKNGFGT